MAEGKKGVLLIDDHPVVGAGVRLLLVDSEEFAICDQATTVEEALEKTAALRPDLIVADLYMGSQNVLDAFPDLLKVHPSARILVYSNQDEATYARRALHAGASGYMMKSLGLEVMPEALRSLARGDHWFSPDIQRTFLKILSCGSVGSSPLDLLSNRELEVFRLLGTGCGSAAIAADLGVSIKTIGSYRENLKLKLHLKTARCLEECAAVFVKTGKLG